MFFDWLKKSAKTIAISNNNNLDTKHEKAIKAFLKNILGCKPGNILLYKIALIHKSCSHKDSKGNKINNERLEYLGDTVLSTVVGDFLFKKYPLQGEGFLTEMRSKIVSRASLNALSKKMGLTDIIEYNKGGNANFISMGGDAFEAIVGALYLDKGYKTTYNILVKRVLAIFLDVEKIESTGWNYKSKIIDWGQKTKRKISFEVSELTELKGRKQYRAEVVIDGIHQQSAIAYSIRSAEQLAAEKTFKKLIEEEIIDPAILQKN